MVTSVRSTRLRKVRLSVTTSNFFYVGCWEYQGDDTKTPELIKEPLEYEAIKVQTRNYKKLVDELTGRDKLTSC